MGVAYEKASLKNQPHFSLVMMKQYWFGKIKAKQDFRLTQNERVAMKLLKLLDGFSSD